MLPLLMCQNSIIALLPASHSYIMSVFDTTSACHSYITSVLDIKKTRFKPVERLKARGNVKNTEGVLSQIFRRQFSKPLFKML